MLKGASGTIASRVCLCNAAALRSQHVSCLVCGVTGILVLWSSLAAVGSANAARMLILIGSTSTFIQHSMVVGLTVRVSQQAYSRWSRRSKQLCTSLRLNCKIETSKAADPFSMASAERELQASTECACMLGCLQADESQAAFRT